MILKSHPVATLVLTALCCALTLGIAAAQKTTPDQLAKQKALFTAAKADLSRGQFEAAETKARSLLRQRPGDPYVRNLLVKVQRAKVEAASHSRWEKTLKTLVVPEINVDEATLEEVVAYVRNKAKLMSGDAAGPNIILQGSEIRDRTLTLKLSRVPLSEVLRFAGNMTGVKFEYQKHAIIGSLKVKPEEPAGGKKAPAPAKSDEGLPAVVGFQSPGARADY